MSFHACTLDMLRVGCHARMLGRVECPANAEIEAASAIGNFMDDTIQKITYLCEMCYFCQKWDTRIESARGNTLGGR
jgi:hypothetical protein